MNREERAHKKQLQQERLSILNQQSELKTKYCKVCPRTMDDVEMCRDCDIYDQLKQLGEQLTIITCKRRNVEPPKPQKERAKMSDLIPSVEYYKELKSKYKTDKAIAEHLNIYIATLNRWKRRNNISTYKKSLI